MYVWELHIPESETPPPPYMRGSETERENVVYTTSWTKEWGKVPGVSEERKEIRRMIRRADA